MPSTLTHALLPAACALLSARTLSLDRRAWWRLALVAACLGNSPDLDLIPATLFPSHWHAIHREWGHNLGALALWSFLGAWWLRTWVSPRFRGRMGWCFSVALVASHVILDGSQAPAPGHPGRPGVPLFWPLSDWEFVTPWPLFGGYLPVRTGHPLLGHLLAPGFWKTVVTRELATIVSVSLLWGLVAALRPRLARRKPSSGTENEARAAS